MSSVDCSRGGAGLRAVSARLLVVAGFAPFLSRLSEADVRILQPFGEALVLLPPVLFLHVFLAYPSGRLERRPERALVVLGYSAIFGLDVVRALLDGAGLDGAETAALSAQRAAVFGVALGALVVLVAVAYPRLRAGLRGALLIPLGLLSIVIGISEAGYYTLEAGASGDDYTGLLAIPAGILLLGLGVVTLWRSRRTDDSLRRRYVRRSLIAAVALPIALIVLFPFLLSYVYTHVARAYVPTPKLGAGFEEVAFKTSDGLTLKGWYIPSKNRAAVISFPGRKGPQGPARMLARHGYGVLLFDRRGEGVSDGDPNSFGWKGERDIHAAAAFLQRRSDVDPDRIGGIGLSVGGEMFIQAAAESEDIKAIVSEGAGARSVREDLELPGNAKWYEFGIPTVAVLTAGTALFSNDLPPPNLKDLSSRIAPRSVFFVYGENGQSGEIELNPIYYADAREPKAIWEVPNAGHTGGITAQPKEYERRVVAFLDAALLP